MRVKNQLLALVSAAITIAACNSTEFKKTPEGFPYKVFSSGKGDLIVGGNVVRYHITQKLEDSLLETTWGNPPMFIPIPKENIEHPLAKLLLEARNGDSIQVIQPIDSLISKEPRLAQDPLFSSNKGKNLVTIVRVMEVFKDVESAQTEYEKESIVNFNKQPEISEQKKKDEAVIEAYLKQNNVSTQRTPWGAYLNVITPGSGPKPKTGQYAMVRYTGKNLQGKEFDSNDKPGAQLLPVQIGAGGVIPGFSDAVKQLSEGGKAIVYIPSVLGYGSQGSPPNIAANENLIFEIEVVDITDQHPSASPMPDSTKN